MLFSIVECFLRHCLGLEFVVGLDWLLLVCDVAGVYELRLIYAMC